jgi:outer membrane protein assembly factor BamA
VITRRFAGPFVVAALLCACGTRPRALAPGQTGVGTITFTGVKGVTQSKLAGGLGLTRARSTGLPYGRYMVSLDRRRIEGYYVRRGFLSVQVESTTKERGNLVDITFAVTEGKRADLTRVEVVGLPPDVAPAELRKLIPTQDGDPFDYEAYELARPTFAGALEQKGYAKAKVDTVIIADRTKSSTTIRLTVSPGSKSVFGPITIEGVDGRLKESVEHRLAMKPGDGYSPKLIAETRTDISDLGRFSLVRVDPDKGPTAPVPPAPLPDAKELATPAGADAPADPSAAVDPAAPDAVAADAATPAAPPEAVPATAEVPIAVVLGLREPHELRLGGGVGYNPISYELRGRASYTVLGWPTTLTNTTGEVRPAVVRVKDEAEFQPRIEALGAIERLDLFRPRLTGAVEASFAYLALEAYTSYGPKLHLSLRSPIYKRIVSASVGWRIQQLKFRDIDEAISDQLAMDLGLDAPERLGVFDQSLIIDLRDQPLSPTRGAYAELHVEEGTTVAGSQMNYIRATPDVRGYVTLLGTTLAARAMFGVIRGDIPVTERLFAGGASTQRGFGERRLAPQAVATVDGSEKRTPYGGGAMFAANVELRRHLATFWKDLSLGGVIFLDGADVTETAGDLSLGNLHWALGAGLRIKYVVPFRLDVGYRLNRIGPNDPDPASGTLDRMALQLSVGEAF